MDGMLITGGWTEIGARHRHPAPGRPRRCQRDRRHRRVPHAATTASSPLHDRCPHKGGPLSQGIVHGHAVTCPLHNWVIDLQTARPPRRMRAASSASRCASRTAACCSAHARSPRHDGGRPDHLPLLRRRLRRHRRGRTARCSRRPGASRQPRPAVRRRARRWARRWTMRRPAAAPDDRRRRAPLGRRRSTSWPHASATPSPSTARTASPSTSPASCLTEDYYVANKLMKGFIGSGNIDTNSRLCMASLGRRPHAGLRRGRGAGRATRTSKQADLVVLVGSNTAWCHPVLLPAACRRRAANAARSSSSSIRAAPRLPRCRPASAAGAGSGCRAVRTGCSRISPASARVDRGLGRGACDRLRRRRSAAALRDGADPSNASLPTAACRRPTSPASTSCSPRTERTVTVCSARA